MPDQAAFPLAWPVGWPRTTAANRLPGSFKGTPDRVRRELLREVDGIALGKGAAMHTIRANVVLSSNVPLRRDGEPMAGRGEPADPGVAVYFPRRGRPMCFACDRYDRVWKNMRAIQKSIEALRGIERWGSSQMMERAFTGFAALPPPSGAPTHNCWTTLGLEPGASLEAIERAHRELSREHHPDRGGSHETMAALNRARTEARATHREGERP